MKMLILGKVKQKDLEEFFGLAPRYLSKNKKQRERYLDILREYCDYEIITGKNGRHNGYEIKEIYDEGPYETRDELRKKVTDFLLAEWGKYDDQGGTADSLTIVANRYCEANNIIWRLPKYVLENVPYAPIDDENKNKIRVIQVKKHNPEMEKWWRVYGIMARHFLKDNKKSHRIFLEVAQDNLACWRLTKEKEQKVQELSSKFFGQRYITMHELKEAAETLKGQEVISFEDLEKQIPVIKHLTNSEKWNAFIRACKKEGVYDVIKGCDRKEIEQIIMRKSK